MRGARTIDARKEAEEAIRKIKNSASAMRMLLICLTRMEDGTNFVTFESGKKCSVSQLAEAVGINRRLASKGISTLERLGILSKLKTKSGKYIVVNPRYFSCGEIFMKEVYDLFEDHR